MLWGCFATSNVIQNSKKKIHTKASSNIKELETLSMEVSSMIHLHMSTTDYMKRLSAFCAHKKTLLEKTLYFDIRLQSVSVCYIFITKCKKK